MKAILFQRPAARKTPAQRAPARIASLLLACCFLASSVALHAQMAAADTPAAYYPTAHHWERAAPDRLGFAPSRLASAVEYAQQQAVTEPHDMVQVLNSSYVGREPNYRILGPTAPRQGSSGLIIRHGLIAAEWGDLERVDMTFSVVKSYLSTLAGLAQQRGLIRDLHDPAGRYVRDGHFDNEHNRSITWHHLLQQTSDWQGSLWDTPDWADRPQGDSPEDWPNRPLNKPGSFFKYNDVRVNLLAYSLLQVWREPLPQVLKREIMDPIGASTTWRWHGYENSWITLDGQIGRAHV